MTPYHEYFYPIFGAGIAIATIASLVAGWTSGRVLAVVSLAMGGLIFWGGLVIGSEVGYYAWQSMPNPPTEAFSDTSAMGALFLGWLPAGIYCGCIFGFTKLAKYLLSRGASGGSGVETHSLPVETGNPYQVPQLPEGE